MRTSSNLLRPEAPRTPAFFEIRAWNFPEAFQNCLAALRDPALNFSFDSTAKLPRKGVTKLAQRVHHRSLTAEEQIQAVQDSGILAEASGQPVSPKLPGKSPFNLCYIVFYVR